VGEQDGQSGFFDLEGESAEDGGIAEDSRTHLFFEPFVAAGVVGRDDERSGGGEEGGVGSVKRR